MSGELGLKHTFKEKIYMPMAKYRGNDGQSGRECRIIDFMQKKVVNEKGGLGLTNAAGTAPISWEDIWCDLGMDPASTTIGNLLSLSGTGLEYLAPELIRDFIYDGLTSSANHLDLCARSENVSSMVVTTPHIKYTNADTQTVREGETIPEGGMEWSHKTVGVGKQAIAIKLTDELVLSCPIPLLAPWLNRVGIQLGAKLYNRAVTVLINGDQADGSDACPVIGVASTTNKLQFEDFVTMWARARAIARNWGTLITSEIKARAILKIDEFKKQQGVGGREVEIQSRNLIIPDRVPHFVSQQMSDSHAMGMDPRGALLYMIFRGLLVESERIIMREINGTKASIISDFATIDLLSRIIMDETLAFSTHGFPASMTPLT